jgi:hypothetical protein
MFQGEYPPIELRQQLRGATQGLKYLNDTDLVRGDLGGVRAGRHLGCLPSSNPPVASIFTTNNKSPKARLADFGATTMALDPRDPISPSLTLEGGTITFMAAELLAPSNFGRGGYLSLWVGHASGMRAVPPPYKRLS